MDACTKGDSNPTDASRDHQPSRDPAVTTQAYVGAQSRFVPPDPWPARVAWQPRGSGSDVKTDFKFAGRAPDPSRPADGDQPMCYWLRRSICVGLGGDPGGRTRVAARWWSAATWSRRAAATWLRAAA